jgi:hypothetical protein
VARPAPLRGWAPMGSPEAVGIASLRARACRSTCGRSRTWLEMGVTPSGTLPTRGTSCDRREGAFRSRAYTPGSMDRHRAVASVKRASAMRCEGWVLRGLLRSQMGYRFWRPKVCSPNAYFFPARFFLIRLVRSMPREMQASPGIYRAIQEDAEQSTRTQGKTGCRGAIQDVPRDHKIAQGDAEPSRNLQRCAGRYRERSCGKA